MRACQQVSVTLGPALKRLTSSFGVTEREEAAPEGRLFRWS